MDQGEEAGTIQPDHRQGSQRFGVAAVELVGSHQIFVKEQLTGAVADAVTGSGTEFHQPLLNNVNSLNQLASPKHTSSRGERQPICFRVLPEQLNRVIHSERRNQSVSRNWK